MTRSPAIEVHNLSKIYRLYESHRDRMKEFLHPTRKLFHVKHQALQNISFTLNQGEALGVIGHNGSGKSTLLKILASVVTPTSGHFTCHGRVAALLELGGGFNDELSGVDNIYFIGALQGYRKKDMKKRVQDILDFAEIGEYAYQPVKSYSSGMYVRLAFAMNIHIDPDILIIDEALAVGDIRFQQKCFRKIKEFKNSGKTIILCSHSMMAIKDFCTRAIWIHQGNIKAAGDPMSVTDSYQSYMSSTPVQMPDINLQSDPTFDEVFSVPVFKRQQWVDLRNYQQSGNQSLQMNYGVVIDPATLKTITMVRGGQRIEVLCILSAQEKISQPGFQLTLNGPFSMEILIINSFSYGQSIDIHVGKPTLLCTGFTFPHLSNGIYSISFSITKMAEGQQEILFSLYDGLTLTVEIPESRHRSGGQLVSDDARMITINPSNHTDL